MTKQDAIKILAILKVAYPASYRSLTREETNATAELWAVQFAAYDYDAVWRAVQAEIGRSKFPPTIAEIKGLITGESNESPALRYPQTIYLDGEPEARVYDPLKDPEFLADYESRKQIEEGKAIQLKEAK